MDASPKRQRTRILNGADGRGHHPAPITRQSSSRSLHDKIPLPLAPEHPGHIFVFGSGDTGQLGLGDEMLTRKKPMPLKVLDDKEIVDIVCGGMHTLAITREGKVKGKRYSCLRVYVGFSYKDIYSLLALELGMQRPTSTRSIRRRIRAWPGRKP